MLRPESLFFSDQILRFAPSLILCYISSCQAINLIFMLCPEIASLSKGNLSPFILNEEEGDFRAKYKLLSY